MSSSSELRLRPAAPADINTIGDLTAQAYVDGGHLTPDSPYVATLRDVLPRLDESLVIEHASSSEIVAVVAALPHGHQMADATRPGEWEFRYLAVRKDHWGAGIARSLIEQVETRAHAAGATQIVLRVVDLNHRAMALYDYLGYEHVPDRDISFESSSQPGLMVTLCLMKKPLGSVREPS